MGDVMVTNKLLLSRKEIGTFLEIIEDSILNNEIVKYFLDIDKEDLIKYSLFFNKIEDEIECEKIATIEVELSLDVNKELKYIVYNYIKRNIDGIGKEEINGIIGLVESLDLIIATDINNIFTYKIYKLN